MILDVRTPSEYQAGHIAGAINIDSRYFASSMKNLDKNDVYLVYCGSGTRSAQVSGLMASSGFAHVNNMKGGYTAWQSAGYP